MSNIDQDIKQTAKPEECCICYEAVPQYICPDCNTGMCYECLKTHIMYYSNVEPHCVKCNARLSARVIFEMFGDSGIDAYLDKAASLMFEIMLQRLPECMECCKQIEIHRKIKQKLSPSAIDILTELDKLSPCMNVNKQTLVRDEFVNIIAESIINLISITLTHYDPPPKAGEKTIVQNQIRSYKNSFAKADLDHIKSLVISYVTETIDVNGFSITDLLRIFRESEKSIINNNWSRAQNKSLGKATKAKFLFRCSKHDSSSNDNLNDNSDASSSSSESIHCNGYVNSEFQCELCGSNYCPRCYECIGKAILNMHFMHQIVSEENNAKTILTDEDIVKRAAALDPIIAQKNGYNTGDSRYICFHKCKPEDVATARNIRESSKPCPKCAARIHKTEGCSQMFCTNCHTGFDWNTGKLITSNFHNPHRMEWLQRNANVVRVDPNDPCEVTQLQHPTLMFRLFQTNHVRGVELPRTNNNRRNPRDIFVDDCLYTVNSKSKEVILAELRKDKLHSYRNEMLANIYNEYIATADLLLRAARRKETEILDSLPKDIPGNIIAFIFGNELLDVMKEMYEKSVNREEHIFILHELLKYKAHNGHQPVIPNGLTKERAIESIFDHKEVFYAMVESFDDIIKLFDELIAYTNDELFKFANIFKIEFHQELFTGKHGHQYMQPRETNFATSVAETVTAQSEGRLNLPTQNRAAQRRNQLRTFVENHVTNEDNDQEDEPASDDEESVEE